MHLLRAFGAFWYDFLVGDRPELFVGAIVVPLAVWMAIGSGLDDAMAGWVLVVGILGVAFLGVLLASRPRRR